MAVLIKTHYKLARDAIKKNRTRSFLTCLGIAIGVASIILILSLMGSVSNLIKEETKEVGNNLIIVRPSANKDSVANIVESLTSANSFQNSNLNITDIETISSLENISAIAPIATSINTITSEKNTFDSVPVLSTTPDFAKIESLTFKYGNFFDEKKQDSNTIILGKTLSLSLFNTINSTVGKSVTILGEKFIVVGVLDEINKTINLNNIDLDNSAIININTPNTITNSVQIQQINIKTINTSNLGNASEDIRNTLIDKKSGDQNFSVIYGDDITHPASDLFNIVSGMLAIVAAISLIVGGIGIMNIMLVSVAERTHEIGIRKSVGASFRNILMQFLFESIILSVTGGVFGLILGYVFSFLLSIITPFAPYISWEIIATTLLTAILVGIVFGIYPALKAATKNPIESLKHYH